MRRPPTFPNHHKNLPPVLRLWNPFHYWYLFVWIFFQPSKLKQYLWRANDKLYRTNGLGVFSETIRNRAYRNVWIMMILSINFYSFSLFVLIALYTIVDWTTFVMNLGLGFLIYVYVSLFFMIVINPAYSLVFSPVYYFAITTSIIIFFSGIESNFITILGFCWIICLCAGVLNSLHNLVVTSTLIIVWIATKLNFSETGVREIYLDFGGSILEDVIVIFVAIMVWIILPAIVTVIISYSPISRPSNDSFYIHRNATNSTTNAWIVTVLVLIVSWIITSQHLITAGLIAVRLEIFILLFEILPTIVLVVVGPLIVFSIILLGAITPLFPQPISENLPNTYANESGDEVSFFILIAFFIIGLMVNDDSATIMMMIMSICTIAFLLKIFLIPINHLHICQRRHKKVQGDLQEILQVDMHSGLMTLGIIAMIPYKRRTVQKILSEHIQESQDPLRLIYYICRSKDLEQYISEPLSNFDFNRYGSKKIILLNLLGNAERDNTFSFQIDEKLAIFCSYLAKLLTEDWSSENISSSIIDQNKFKFDSSFYPNGLEIIYSFSHTRVCLECIDIESIIVTANNKTWLAGLSNPLRPVIIEAHRALVDISQQVTHYQVATNSTKQAAHLNTAAGRLVELETFVEEQVLPPEQALFIAIINNWQDIIAEEQGKLGQAALQQMSRAEQRAAGLDSGSSSEIWATPDTPIDNPYIVGDPVYPPLFVGRSDIFNRISEVWGEKENPDSIILYGHRRMGKSSILRNLGEYAPAGHLVAYLDMAGETSFAASTADLLLTLADALYNTAIDAYPDAELTEPNPDDYDQPNHAQRAFNRLCKQIERLIGKEKTVILALDEFEAIEQAVDEGKIGAEIFQFLRTKTQEPWLTLVFGGLHTLDEMSRDYQKPFYGSYTNIHVSYLSEQEARRLITNPAPDSFFLNYEHEAVELIMVETGRQPYLVQQLCRDALDHLNHEIFDLGVTRETKITVADVQDALGDELFQRSMVYFDGVWRQTENGTQQWLLQVMAQQDGPWSKDELIAAMELDGETVQQALRWAERHDVLYQEEGRWGFYVPLMRRWLREKRPLGG